VGFKFQLRTLFVVFIFHKNGLIKVFHPLKINQLTKFHGPALTGASFPSPVRSLNVHHFGIVESTGLKSVASRSPSVA
jgi:hypothetical protein